MKVPIDIATIQMRFILSFQTFWLLQVEQVWHFLQIRINLAVSVFQIKDGRSSRTALIQEQLHCEIVTFVNF